MQLFWFFWYIQCLHLMYSEEAWELVFSGTHVQPQIILDSDSLPDYFFVSYDYVKINYSKVYLIYLIYLILVSNCHGCTGQAIELMRYYMIDIMYKTIKSSHLKILQIIQNINNLLFQVIFFFSDWVLIKQIKVSSIPG